MPIKHSMYKKQSQNKQQHWTVTTILEGHHTYSFRFWRKWVEVRGYWDTY